MLKDLYKNGRITDWELWRLLSAVNSPFLPGQAGLIYVDLGFEPFAGYPLIRKG